MRKAVPAAVSDCVWSNRLDEKAPQGQLKEVEVAAEDVMRGHRALSRCNGSERDLSGDLFVTDRLSSAAMRGSRLGT